MGVALLTLAVSLLYIPGLPSNVAIGRWSAILVGSAILLLVRWRDPIVPGRAHWLGGALLLYMLAGFAWTVSGWDTGGALVQWVALGATFLVAYQQPDLDQFWRALWLGVSLSAPFAVVQWFGYSPVWVVAGGVAGGGGAAGLFLSQNMAGEAALLGLVAAGAVFMQTAAGLSTKGRIYAAVVLPLGPLVLALAAGGRAPYVAAVLALVTWGWLARPRYRGPIILLVAGVALAVLVVWALDLRPSAFRFADRAQIWSLFLRNLHLFGDGLGSVAIAAPGIGFAHNEVIHYAFELGVGSLLLWALLWHAVRSGDAFGCAALATVGAFALTWFPLHDPLPAFATAVLAGSLSARRDRALCLERAIRTGSLAGSRFDERPRAAGAV